MFQLISFFRPYAKYILIIWLLTIIIVSSIPSIPTLKIHTAKSEIRLDYLIHFCEYGFLAFMAFLSFTNDRFVIGSKKYFLITLSLIAFAVLDELHQKLIPGRAFNVKDIMSDVAGIMGALVFCLIVFRMIMKQSTQN